jgi:NTP pyrophosphatase (non-canonical NTP hydrolase)
MSDTVSVTIKHCDRQTDKAYRLTLTGIEGRTGEVLEFASWWPKSQISIATDGLTAYVPDWLLGKKLEEAFGDFAADVSVQ